MGRKALGRAGCCACHDIPGLEDAKPIGPELTGWGRKNEQQLALESVLAYLEGTSPVDPPSAPTDLPDFYLLQLKAGHRAGFAFQKLREPRSYDFRRTEKKRYTERLRMPQFSLDNADREAIITFLLGLTADPPARQYTYVPDAQHRAWIEGREVLDQYRCKTCHILEPERWSVAFPPGELRSQPDVPQYPFLRTRFPAHEIAASRAVDAAGMSSGIVAGLPTLDSDGLPRVFDEDGFPLEDDEQYPPSRLEQAFDLWRPAVLGGNRYDVGVMPLNLPSRMVDQRLAADGGFLARYLLAPSSSASGR